MSNINVEPHNARYWTGANLVSDEELNAEIEKDPYVKSIRAEIARIRVLLDEQRIARDKKCTDYRNAKHACHKTKGVIAGRERQLKHHINAIRLRVAYDKLKEARKKIFNN